MMKLSGDWYWLQDAEQVIRRIVYRGREQSASFFNDELPFLDMPRWQVDGLKLIDKRFDWNSLRAHMLQGLPFDKVEFEYWPTDRKRLIFESTGQPIEAGEGLFSGYVGVSCATTEKRLNEQLLALQRFLLQGVVLSAPLSELAASYARGLKNCLTVHAEVLIGFRAQAQNVNWTTRGSDPTLQISPEVGSAIWDFPEQHCQTLSDPDSDGLVWLGQLQVQYVPSQWVTGHGIQSVWMACKKSPDPLHAEYWILVAQKTPIEPVEEDRGRILTALRLLGLCVERRVFEDELQSVNTTLEQRIESRTAELVRVNSELEAFTCTVSHDLRAPLRAIAGFSAILREDFQSGLPVQAVELLKRIESNVQQMTALMDALLDFSRLLHTELDLVETDLHTMLNQVVDRWGPSARACIDVTPLPVVQADPLLLQQVWINLIDNALKFTARCESPRIQIASQENAQGWQFSIRDNGVGFDMQQAGRLFNVFERLHSKKQFEGTGVGLAIVKRIVERHGGRVWANSQLNQGTEITFSLPRVG